MTLSFTLTDGIILSIIIVIFCLICVFTFKGKKSKNKCHGCPYLKTCEKNNCSKNDN